MRTKVAMLSDRHTPICEGASVRKLDKICRDLRISARKYFQSRKGFETCVGVCFVSTLVAVGSVLPMI